MSSNRGVADGLHSCIASTSISRNAASTVRPRARRLISPDGEEYTNDDGLGTQQLSSARSTELTPPRSRVATPSPYASRGASPLPLRHPSRGTEYLPASGKVRERSSDLLESSWSSLQSLASSVLGSDIGRPPPNGAETRSHPRRKPSRSENKARNAPRSSLVWGPPGQTAVTIGTGFAEQRHELLQAKRREALLLADADSALSSRARHKRRVSTDEPDPTAIDPDQDEDVLVYIHRVQPTDSITGLTIRYGCQPAAFRKTNGFWPSDSIQSRKMVLLPVESCSVRGRPIRPAGDVNFASSEYTGNRLFEDLNGTNIAPDSVSDTTLSALEFEPQVREEGDRTWKHDSWVQIEGFQSPVEIGRVSRRTMGFFPRTRRKSIPYSDLAPPSPRPSDSGHQASPRQSSEPQAAPFVTDVMPASHPVRHQRQRSYILAGPGVGRLDQNTIVPGPAPDSLNKFFAQHIPTLAAPSPLPAQQRTSFESTSTAASNASTGLDNLGGVLEGWVRRVATRAKAGLSDLQQEIQGQQGQRRDSRSAAAVGLSGVGDLIELDDGLDVRVSSTSTVLSCSMDADVGGLNYPASSSLFAHAGAGRSSSASGSLTSRSRSSNCGDRHRLKDD